MLNLHHMQRTDYKEVIIISEELIEHTKVTIYEKNNELPFLEDLCIFVLWQQVLIAQIANYPVTSLFPSRHALTFLPVILYVA